jgi:CheY-like chemotaxis protein
LIDDDPNMHLLMEHFLPKSIHLDVASSGEDGLKSISENQYDLVFLDLEMPGMDGWRTIKRIKENFPEYPGKIIAVTAHDKEDILSRIQEAGFTVYLSKPPKKHNLLSLVKKFSY